MFLSHLNSVSRPAWLSFGEHGIDARKFCTPQNLSVRDHVAPTDGKRQTNKRLVDFIGFVGSVVPTA